MELAGEAARGVCRPTFWLLMPSEAYVFYRELDFFKQLAGQVESKKALSTSS